MRDGQLEQDPQQRQADATGQEHVRHRGAAPAHPAGAEGEQGGAEGGASSYNASFGDRRGKDQAKEMTGKSLTEMTLAEVKAYQSKRGDRNAVGKYQFMKTTLFGSGTGRKRTMGLVDQLKIPMNSLFTPELQEQIQSELTKQNIRGLGLLNIPATPGAIYGAHYLGAGGLNAVRKQISTDPNMSVAGAMRAAGLRVGANPELENISVSNFENLMGERLIQRGGLGRGRDAGQLETATASLARTQTAAPMIMAMNVQAGGKQAPPVSTQVVVPAPIRARTQDDVVRAIQTTNAV